MLRRLETGDDLRRAFQELRIKYPTSKAQGCRAGKEQSTICELYVVMRDGVEVVDEKVFAPGRSRVGWY